MPKKHLKQELEEALESLLVLDLLSDLLDSSEDNALGFPSLTGFPTLFALYAFQSSRYSIKRTLIPKSLQWVTDVMPSYSDARFKIEVRVTRATFGFILNAIQDNRIFQSHGNVPQAPVARQLQVALYRFGAHGNAGAVRRVGARFGIGDGTAMLFTQRVITAINALYDQYVVWPSVNERTQIATRIMDHSKFPNCVGLIDGTDIVLEQRPHIDGELYFNRKKRYAISAQVVVDDKKIFRYLNVGMPGSVHDSRVFHAMSLHTSRERYFKPEEYLLADNGYPCYPHIIVPFKKPAANLRENRRFNFALSNMRVRVEHAIGILKSRFMSLRGLRMNLYRRSHIVRAVEWVKACIILHNIVMKQNDDWDYEESFQEEDDVEAQNDNEVREHVIGADARLSQAGAIKRDYLKGIVLI